MEEPEESLERLEAVISKLENNISKNTVLLIALQNLIEQHVNEINVRVTTIEKWIEQKEKN